MSTLGVAIVGAGPSGISFLERFSANLHEVLGDANVEIHLIDPFPPGAGRVWRHDQSSLLWMNSMAQDVTMYTDDSVRCEGPIVPGPTLVDWAAQMRDIGLSTPELTAEARALIGTTFPTRRLQSAYLSWVYQDIVDRFGPNVRLVVHPHRAIDLVERADGRQQVCLDGPDEPVVADLVVLTLGHLDVAPEDLDGLASFAAAHDLSYLAPDFTADVDLSAFEAGSTVVVRGMGLAAVDATVLLTEGRGGRFETNPDGSLTYHPSGSEPHLVLGSRRGVPYHGKLIYALHGSSPQLPRFLDADTIDAILAQPGPLDFWADIWPTLAKEVLWAYYHELFSAHPERTTIPWEEFDRLFAEAATGSAAQADLIARAVPGAADRFDFESFDRPLAGVHFQNLGELQEHLRTYIEADLDRRADPSFSADLGLFNALLVSFGAIGRIGVSGRLDLESRRRDVDGWWRSFFNYYASGPPGRRLHELLALSRAGVVEFLGAGIWVEPGPDGRLRAGSASTPEVVVADGLIEARNPGASVKRSRNDLVRRLHERGHLVEEELVDAGSGTCYPTGKIVVSKELRLVDDQGVAHPRRVAIGFPTNRPAAGTFSRPRTNAPAFRQNDAVARSVLAELAKATPAYAGPI